TIALTWCDDETDPQYTLSRESLAALEAQTDAKGRSIEVIKIPMPGPLYMTAEEASGIDAADGMEREAGERLAASYANYLISNKHIIFPLLDPKTDGDMEAMFKRMYP
ncbi:agmatine deiminase family protein, partial [Vibrio sp. 10N.222.49.C9]